MSQNGKAWQVTLMVDNQKTYLGIFDDAHLAACIYDIAIIQSKGLASTKVNFEYNKTEILAMLFERSIINIKRQL